MKAFNDLADFSNEEIQGLLESGIHPDLRGVVNWEID